MSLSLPRHTTYFGNPIALVRQRLARCSPAAGIVLDGLSLVQLYLRRGFVVSFKGRGFDTV